MLRSLPAPGRYLCGLTWDGCRFWHSDQEAATIYALDPDDGRVVRSFPCADVRADLAFDGTYLCQVGGRPKRLLLIDPETGGVAGERQIRPPSGRVTGAEYGPDGVWLLLREPNVVQLRDHPTMRLLRELPVPGSSPSGLTVAGGVVVYGQFDPGLLQAVEPADGSPLGSLRLPGRPTGITWDGERIWYCDFPARRLRSVELDEVLAGPPVAGTAQATRAGRR